MKTIKAYKLLNDSEILNLPVWGNMYFKIGNTCLYLKEIMKDGRMYMYVQDFVNDNLNLLNDVELFDSFTNKQNVYIEMKVIKIGLFKRL